MKVSTTLCLFLISASLVYSQNFQETQIKSRNIDCSPTITPSNFNSDMSSQESQWDSDISPTPNIKLSITPTSTLSITPTSTPKSTSSITPTSTPKSTSSITPTSTLSITPTSTLSITSTSTLSITSTSTPKSTSSITPTSTLSITPTSTLSITPTSTLSITPTSTLSITPTSTPIITLINACINNVSDTTWNLNYSSNIILSSTNGQSKITNNSYLTYSNYGPCVNDMLIVKINGVTTIIDIVTYYWIYILPNPSPNSIPKYETCHMYLKCVVQWITNLPTYSASFSMITKDNTVAFNNFAKVTQPSLTTSKVLFGINLGYYYFSAYLSNTLDPFNNSYINTTTTVNVIY